MKAVLARHRHVVAALTTAEFRKQRDLTAAGMAKWLLEPLSFMLVYFVLVASVLGRTRPAYPLFLFCALIPWRFFSSVSLGALFLLPHHAELIRNRAFAPQTLPVAAVLAEAPSLVVSLVLFVPFMIVYDVAFTAALLWTPVILAVLTLLTIGPTMLAAVLGLYFPDFRAVVQNTIRAGFFVSSALVPVAEVPGDRLPRLLDANPFTGVFDAMRSVVLTGRSPAVGDLLYPTAVAALLVGLGVLSFAWRRWDIPKHA